MDEYIRKEFYMTTCPICNEEMLDFEVKDPCSHLLLILYPTEDYTMNSLGGLLIWEEKWPEAINPPYLIKISHMVRGEGPVNFYYTENPKGLGTYLAEYLIQIYSNDPNAIEEQDRVSLRNIESWSWFLDEETITRLKELVDQ